MVHDATVDRTTDGKGYVNDFTYEELSKLDAGCRFSAEGGKTFPWRGRGIRIPNLAELVDSFPQDNFNIEIKDTSQTAARILVELIKKKGILSQVMVVSEHQTSIGLFRSLAPDISTSAATKELRKFIIWGKLSMAFFS